MGVQLELPDTGYALAACQCPAKAGPTLIHKGTRVKSLSLRHLKLLISVPAVAKHAPRSLPSCLATSASETFRPRSSRPNSAPQNCSSRQMSARDRATDQRPTRASCGYQ
jgi:hypothetical protein